MPTPLSIHALPSTPCPLTLLHSATNTSHTVLEFDGQRRKRVLIKIIGE